MNKKDSPVKVTLEDVLEVTQKGFEHLENKIDTGLAEVRKDISEIKSDLAGVKDDVIRIENIILRKQVNDIEKLQDDMRIVKTKLALP